jgi:DNA-binding SARP family transcriptional activator
MLEVQLLGKFEVTRDDQPIKIPSRQAQSLLAYLILNIGASHRREKLAGLLWPDFSEANARSNLRQTLWRLRRAIGDAYFMADKVSIGFACNNNCKFDVAILADEAAEARSPDELVSIVSVYKGRLLPGFYDDWVLLERERLQAVFESRMQLLLKRLIEEERWQEVRDWAERWISLGQVPEPAYRALMLAHAGLGDQASLASVYQRCIDVLNTELGVEPARETRELYLRLIRSEKPSQVNLEAPIGPSRVVEAGHPTSNLDRALEQEIRFCTSPDGVRLA